MMNNQAHGEISHVLAMVELVNNDNELIDWDYWAGKMPRWTAHQAVRLMAALDPTKHNDLSFRRNETAGAAKERAKRLEDLAASFGMTEATPLEWLAWADKISEPVHGGLRVALQKPTDIMENGYEDRYRAVIEHANGAMLNVAELDAWATSNKVSVSFETLLKDESIAEDYNADRHFVHYSLLSIVLASRLVPEDTEPSEAAAQLMASGDASDHTDPVRCLRDLVMVRYDRQLLNAVFDGDLNLYDSLTMSPIDLSAARQRYKANPDAYAAAAQARIMDATGGNVTPAVREKSREILRQKFARLDQLAWAMVILSDDAPPPGEHRYRQILDLTRWLQGLGLPFRHSNGLPASQYKGVPLSCDDLRERQYLAVADVQDAAIAASCWPISESTFTDEDRHRIVNAQYWNERELLAFCLGVPTYADRDDIAPEVERDETRERISAAIRTGDLPAEPNPYGDGKASAVYGGIWRIEPARAVRWALGKFPKLPEWLAQSQLREIYAMQEAEKQAAGRYTLREAAHAIASVGERFDAMERKLCSAAERGDLFVYAPGELARYHYPTGKNARPDYDETYWDELNDWLEKNEPRIAFKFAAPTNRPGPSPSLVPDPTDSWQAKARAIADECFDRDTENSCRDSLKGYAKRVMEEMQRRQIHGPRGLIDNPNTVQREALQGSQWWKGKAK